MRCCFLKCGKHWPRVSAADHQLIRSLNSPGTVRESLSDFHRCSSVAEIALPSGI